VAESLNPVDSSEQNPAQLKIIAGFFKFSTFLATHRLFASLGLVFLIGLLIPANLLAGSPADFKAAPKPAGVQPQNLANETGWITTTNMSQMRLAHTQTLMQNGKVLVTGGFYNAGPFTTTATAEIYDPATGKWRNVASMQVTRAYHTATLLPSGKVLVAGGLNISNGVTTNTAELFDPVTETWSSAGTFNQARQSATATLLNNGKVLIVGGYNSSNTGGLASANLYDPSTNSWSTTANLATARHDQTATLLQNGLVLVAGGISATSTPQNGTYPVNTELFDPDGNGGVGTWTATGDLTKGRSGHSATLLTDGRVLVAGGYNNYQLPNGSDSNLAGVEIYDPDLGTWTAGASLNTARSTHRAALLPDGEIIVVGGAISGTVSTATTEIYNPTGNSWTAGPSMSVGRSVHRTTLLPGGRLLVTGGTTYDGSQTTYLDSAELLDYNLGSWSVVTATTTARANATTTLLTNGKVLIAGGSNSGTTLNTAELYDPATQTFSPGGTLNTARRNHTATLLQNGKVLVAGGLSGDGTPLDSTELYDPDTNSWMAGENLLKPLSNHTATLLPSGQVLLAGGEDAGGPMKEVELFDPTHGTWSYTTPLGSARTSHTTTLLAGGKVLVVGGSAGSTILNTAEIYDPSNGTWSTTPTLNSPRAGHTATLLPGGQVLVAGGASSLTPVTKLSSAEIYDPSTNTWTATGNMAVTRQKAAAVLMQGGKVLVAGGDDAGTDSELYDPATSQWQPTANLNNTHAYQGMALLLTGQVLLTGDTSQAELYDAGLNFEEAWRPTIDTANTTLAPGEALELSGNGFKGLSEASGNSTNNSSSNYPLVQLSSLDNEQTFFVLPDPTSGWADTAFTGITQTINTLPPGYARLTIFSNGIPSLARIVLITGSASSTVITSAPNPSDFFQTVTFTATITTGQGQPTGAVNFMDGSTLLGTGYINDGNATFVTNTLSAGTHTIVAEYKGDLNFAGSISPGLDQQVNCTQVYTVYLAEDNGTNDCGTLTFALNQAATANVPVTITLTPATISLTEALPVITPTVKVTIAGTCTQANGRGLPGTKLIAGVGDIPVGLQLTSNMALTGVAISGFQDYQVELTGNNNTLTCDWLGTLDGLNSPANSAGGGLKISGSNNRLGIENTPSSGNLISGNAGTGLKIDNASTGNESFYTWIGVKSDGITSLKNLVSLKIDQGGQLKFGPGNRIHS